MEFLTKEEIEDFRVAFNMFDNDGSGTISSRELVTAMQNLNLKPKEEEIQNLMKQVDDDGGGDIDFHEFLVIMGNKLKALKKDEEVFNIFRVFDRDRNGYITAEEMKFAMNKMGFEMTHREATRMIREADLNGDGLIDYHEFYTKMTSGSGKKSDSNR